MKHLGLTQKLCMAGWLLSAAILGAINAFPLVALEEAPMQGDPVNLRALRSKLSLLESLSAANLRQLSDQERLQSFYAAYRSPQNSASTDMTPVASAEKGDPDETMLPRLTGVLQRVGSRGLPYYIAVLDGRVCAEKDEVRMFTVATITAEGAVVQRAGKQWFLPSPQPYYNSDEGR